MKKIFVLISVYLLFFAGSAWANNVYLEGAGAYGDYGDAKKMYGFSGGIGYELMPRVSVWGKFLNSSTKETNTYFAIDYTDKYSSKIFYAAAEYDYPIKSLPLYWATSLGFGINQVDVKVYNSVSYTWDEANEKGMFAGIWTGARYHLTQRFGIFALAGYHKTFGFTGDLKDAKISGYQIQIGVTATVYGKNARLDEGY